MAAKDLPAVLEIERKSNAAPWSPGGFEAELRNPQAVYYCLFEGESLVAYAGFWAVVDEAHITTIAVHPEHRRKRYGEALMKRLLKEAKQRKLSCSTLEVRASNAAAILLYEKLGYVRCGLRKGYYPNNREDAVIMWLYDLDTKNFE